MQKLGWSGKARHFLEVSRTSVLLGCRDAIWQGRKALLLASIVFSPFTGSQCPVLAQSNLVPDNTLGSEASRVIFNSYNTPNEAIEGGAQRGQNLFHSFRGFNVGENRGVYFHVLDPSIQNIFARVTASNRSEILGTLGTRQIIDGNLFRSNVNLFLINPNGIIFGKGARLDIGGSFYGTTATGIQFGNQGNFSATNPQAPGLLTVNPSAFLFNQINQNAAIQNNGFLEVPEGRSFAIVGGNVNLDGGILFAPGGRAELGGLTEPGSIEIQSNRNNFSLSFPNSVQRGDISLSDRSTVFVVGEGGGDITLNARNIEISGTSLLDAGIAQGLGTPETVAGDITLNATGEIKITDSGSGIVNFVYPGAKGNGGNISINTSSFKLRDNAELLTENFGQGKGGNININATTFSLRGAQISTSTYGQGNAGNVNVKVTGEVDIAGIPTIPTFIFSRVEEGAEGNAGNITIDAGSFKLRDAAQISASTYGKGNAGNVTVTAKDAISLVSDAYIFSTIEEGGIGKGGDININAATLSLQEGGFLSASTDGWGNAGNVNVKVAGEVNIADIKGEFPSRIRSIVGDDAKGNAGNITIDAGSLKFRDGGQISTSNFGEGNAGNVNVKVAGEVDITGAKDGFSSTGVKTTFSSGIFSRVVEEAKGNGGNITIDAGSLKLRDGGEISNSTFGEGNAGNVNVKVAGEVDITGAKTGEADITGVKTTFSSGIRSRVEISAVGNGGNINIDAGSFNFRGGAQVGTSTSGQGNAGNIRVNAKGAVSLADNAILTTVEAGGVGNGGNIDINAATLSLIDSAQLLTATRGASDTQPAGRGNAGNVNVKVTGEVDIAGVGVKNGISSGISSIVLSGTEGNGGNIIIDAGSFKLQDGAQLATSTYGKGNAGSVTVIAKDAVSLTNGNIFSTVEAGGVGKGGNIDINAASLSLNDSAQLLTITRAASDSQPAGRGDAGNVNVKVTGKVDISGVKNRLPSAISSLVDTGTEGNGGNITVDAGSFKVRDGALLDSRTNSNNRGGNITINTNVFEALNGGKLSAITSSNGGAGKITVNANNKVIISGFDPDYNDPLTILINRIRNLEPNSGFFVGSVGSGITGDIEINSPKITLDNQGRLNAESASGNGGNIKLNSDLLLLRRGSQITTNAGTAQQGGNGGNIEINSRFIVAIPKENSNITANAFTGKGGNVNITSRGIFGIEPRTQETNQSDITASSELGVTGNINLNSPDNSAIQNNLGKLPQTAIDTNALIANSCIARRNQQQNGSFFITGSGGLPVRPGDASLPSYSTGDVQPIPTEATTLPTQTRPWQIGDRVIEPTGVYELPNGKLVLGKEC
jgi:filamentous hemagglutinin family protein